MAKALMVSPNHFDVLYSINPWMNPLVKVNKQLMRKQWEKVREALLRESIEVEVLEGEEGLPDMVFAANAGMISKNKAIVSSFRDKERQGEEQHFTRWFKEAGFDTHILSPGDIWEGEACSVFIDGHLVCSLGGRSNKQAYTNIARIWTLSPQRLRFMELIDPYFYHLDVSFCKLNEKSALICPLAFKAEDYTWLKKHIPYIIEVSYDDALSFGCNAFVEGNTIFISNMISEGLRDSLQNHGLNVVLLEVTEFIKAGGGVKCMILRVR